MRRRTGVAAIVVAGCASLAAVAPATASQPRRGLTDGPGAARVAEASRAFARAMGIPAPSVFWRGLLGGQRWSIPPVLGRDVVVVPDRIHGPIARSWDAVGYSPVSGEVYYGGPSYLRTQARYAVRLRLLP